MIPQYLSLRNPPTVFPISWASQVFIISIQNFLGIFLKSLRTLQFRRFFVKISLKFSQNLYDSFLRIFSKIPQNYFDLQVVQKIKKWQNFNKISFPFGEISIKFP